MGNDFVPMGWVVIGFDHSNRGSSTNAADMMECYRWTVKNAKTWRIDTTRIAIAGESRGAATSLYAAYNSTQLPARAVASLWGYRSTALTKRAPLILVHGTADPVVSYSNSVALASEAARIGLTHEFISLLNAPHSPYNRRAEFYPQIQRFFYKTPRPSRTWLPSPRARATLQEAT